MCCFILWRRMQILNDELMLSNEKHGSLTIPFRIYRTIQNSASQTTVRRVAQIGDNMYVLLAFLLSVVTVPLVQSALKRNKSP